MKRKIAAALVLGAIGALSGAGRAQCPDYHYRLLVAEGNTVAGVGAITGFGQVAVNAHGVWTVEAETDHPDPQARRVVLRSGDVALRQGQPLAQPLGATLRAVDDFGPGQQQDAAWLLSLDGTAGAHDDSGVYFNEQLLVQEGDFTGPMLPLGTTYGELIGLDLNRDDEILLMAGLDIPGAPSETSRALLVLVYDRFTGGVTERIVYQTGDILPGQVEPVENPATGPGQFALADNGRAIGIVDLAGPTDVDSAIYLDGEAVAQEGDDSPVAGRAWGDFGDAAVAVGARRAAVRARLDGDPASDTIIAQWREDITSSGWRLTAQEGQPVPGKPSETITTFSAAPVAVGGSGEPVWYGAWSGGEAIFEGRDSSVIVAGETVIDGQRAGAIADGPDAFSASDSGSPIIARITLESGAAAVVLAERLSGCRCYADFDCNGVLDFFDFLAFQTAFALGEPHADCDASGRHDLFDFLCFQDEFSGGCCP